MAMIGGIRRQVTRDDAIAPKKRDNLRRLQKGDYVCGGTHQVKEASGNIEIVSAAKFAVEDHNKKKNASLEFVRVLSAKKKLVAGMIYDITLEATDGGKKKLYLANVYVRSWLNLMDVKYFKFLGETAVLPLELRGAGYNSLTTEESHASVN